MLVSHYKTIREMGIVESGFWFDTCVTLEALCTLSIQRSLFFTHIYSMSKSNNSWPRKCRLSEMRIMLYKGCSSSWLHGCFPSAYAAAIQAVHKLLQLGCFQSAQQRLLRLTPSYTHFSSPLKELLNDFIMSNCTCYFCWYNFRINYCMLGIMCMFNDLSHKKLCKYL